MNPTTTPQMDNDVINLAKAIRQTESGGDFNAKGASGEHGAYQWTPNTWKAHAKQALGDENAQMTPANQNAVAYTVLKSWKDQGLNPAQIAAKWNSGSETGWENKVGTNSMGVHYDVPKYVKSVTDAYQQVKAGHTPPVDPNNPSSTAAPQQQPEESLGSKVGGFLKELASPVATMVARPFQAVAGLAGASNEDIDKWTEDNMNTVGLSGLIAPTPKNFSDLPKDIGRGIETASFGTKSLVKGGALLGLGSSMEQGNPVLSGETALNVGLGAAGGKALGVAGKVLSPIASSVLTKTGLMPEGMAERAYNTAKNKVVKAYEEQLPLTPTQKIKEAELLKRTGDNAYTTYAEHGINIGSPEAAAQLQQVSDHYASGIAQAQKQETARFSLPELQKEIQAGIDSRLSSEKARNTAKATIQDELDALLKANPASLHPDGTIDSNLMERLRKIGNDMTPFNASDPQKVGQSTGYALANAVRDLVEQKGTFPAYREANREWSKIIHAQEVLGRMENSGKDFRKIGGLSGQVAQRVLSGAMGYHSGGIGGAILAEMGTDAASRIISNPKYKTYLSRQIIKNFHNSNPSKSALSKLAKQVEAHIKSEEAAQATRLALPGANKEHVMGVTPTLVKKTVVEPPAKNIRQYPESLNAKVAKNTPLALPAGNPERVGGVVPTLPTKGQVEPPAKMIRQYPESRDTKLQALKKKQEYQPQDYTPEQEYFKEAEHKIITQMSELSTAGYRKPNADGGFTGVESTFPKWVPEHLRKTKYFTQAVKAYENGEYPRGSKANELLALLKNKIEEEARKNAETASYESMAR